MSPFLRNRSPASAPDLDAVDGSSHRHLSAIDIDSRRGWPSAAARNRNCALWLFRLPSSAEPLAHLYFALKGAPSVETDRRRISSKFVFYRRGRSAEPGWSDWRVALGPVARECKHGRR